ncbi:MAG: right-handed parallel beta-helix repeat-containing protein [Planctomycetes bacterium]|nr:right-handed parallel beta-helix repeat-containing protein [Planctomycetota bacterium]
MTHRNHLLAHLAIPLILAPSLLAQIPLTGALSGTLAPAVYHATGNLSVAMGQTLTLPAGVIIKFNATELNVAGTLICNGTAANPVIFTALADDSAGGDTNGNGPSVGNPAAWRGIVFAATASASALTRADIRYGGSGFVSNLHLNACNATFTNCVVRDNYTHGMHLSGNSRPAVAGCTFTGNGGFAIDGAPIRALAGFASNSAAGNNGNYARVTDGSVDADLTIAAAAMISGAVVIEANIGVPANRTLTLQAGVIVKLRNAYEFTIDGTLRTQGTAGNPVVFTGIADDSAGGDTNGDGPSTAGPTAWRGIVFGPGAGNSALTFTDIRYGGSGFVSNLHLNACNPTFTDCVIRHCYTHGMNLNGNSAPTVTRCTFTANGSFAIEGVAIGAVPGLIDNSASGNGGNYARVTAGGVSGSVTIGPRSMLGGAVVIDTTIGIPVGATLTFQPGVNVKLRNPHEFTIDGTLVTQGTAGSPVVFTGIADDSAGGDTNGDGPGAAGPTAWRGLVFGAGASASTLDWADVRYGGSGFVSNLELNGCNPTFRNCVTRDCYTHGMDLNNSARPTVRNCTFLRNGNYAVEGVDITAVPGFVNNTAANNNNGNFLRITSGTVTGALTVGPAAMINGALVLATSLVVAPTGVLTIEQGTVWKCQNPHEVNVAGRIDARGTGYEPVVFTDLNDDDFGGDTNSNGVSTGSPTAWRGVICTPTAGPSRLENVVIRFTGSGFVPGLTVDSPNVALRSVRVDRAYDRGFVLSQIAGSGRNLVAWGCGGHGFHLTGGSFDVVHATVAGCGRGFRRDGWNGTVVNSIAWGNASNFDNFGGGAQVVRSNGGFAGSNGNTNVDPLFVAQPTGDLHLQAASPCLNVADLAIGVQTAKDFDENSRVLDHALTGAALPDLGAFERGAWDMVLNGTIRVGSVPTLTVTGPPGFSFWFMGALDGTFPVHPYGMLLAGLPGASIALLAPQPVPVGFTVPFVLANDPALIGATAGFQTLTFPVAGIATGNFTRLLRALVRP